MANLNPPFRADHVGSLLRPPQVHAARQRRADGELDAAGLRAVEDEAIADDRARAGGDGDPIDHRR